MTTTTKKMSLDTLAGELAGTFDMSKKGAKNHITEIFDSIAENMAAGYELNVPGFGKFRPKYRKEREARNPRTGETMTVAAKTVPNFLAAKQLKETVNGS